MKKISRFSILILLLTVSCFTGTYAGKHETPGCLDGIIQRIKNCMGRAKYGKINNPELIKNLLLSEQELEESFGQSNITYMDNLNKQDEESGLTLLQKACWDGNINKIDILLKPSNLEINKQDQHQNTALHYACITIKPELRKEIIEKLLIFGADPRISNKLGNNPLHLIASSKCLFLIDYEILNMLINCSIELIIKQIKKYNFDIILQEVLKKNLSNKSPLDLLRSNSSIQGDNPYSFDRARLMAVARQGWEKFHRS